MDSTIFWLAVFGIGTGYELWAWANSRKGDTLTEKVRPLYKRVPALKFVGSAFFVWLIFHFLGVAGT